jgi:hypothetical protein
MKKAIILTALLINFSIITEVNAQCSMCRQAAESGIKKGEVQGKGLNRGILFLMSIPYILGGTAFVIYKRNKRKNSSVEQ